MRRPENVSANAAPPIRRAWVVFVDGGFDARERTRELVHVIWQA